MQTRVVFPGTFDPITLGHLDLVARAARLFDEVIVAVAMSPGKRPLFQLDERVALAQAACRPFANVRVEGFSGLLVDFARQVQANVLVRGVRTTMDFEYEAQLAAMYRRLLPQLEILFLPPAEEHAFVASSLIREIALHGGEVDQFVPPEVARAIRLKLNPASQH
ncbi:MAG: pantetheine-phosphate adenylyltransferase [Aeromonadaceae bacterium]|nr:pantetheine-phosphate adenylyltransferase [Aeromonadaceae bacterium]